MAIASARDLEGSHAHSDSMVGTRDNGVRAGGAAGSGEPRTRRRVGNREGTRYQNDRRDIPDDSGVPERDDGQIFYGENEKLFGRTEGDVGVSGCDDDEIDHAERTLGRGENEERNDTNVDKVRDHDDITADDF